MIEYYSKEKLGFYELAAKRFKAEIKLYGATAAVHIENKNDEIFWGKMLHHVYPKGRFRFISSSRSMNGNMTCGCTQCLQYRPFLSKEFIIAIDSDYRYLSQEPFIDAYHHILQTYTYSFENHFCYGPNANLALQEALHTDKSINQEFDFCQFLHEYSYIVYPLLVWQLYLESINPDIFPKHVFHRLLTLPIGARSLDHNGAAVLKILKERARKMITHFQHSYPDADFTWYEARCNALGVHHNNAYLFVRGHQLYDCINMQGRKFVSMKKKLIPQDERSGASFEKALTNHLFFGDYPEIKNIERDICIALDLDEKQTALSNDGKTASSDLDKKQTLSSSDSKAASTPMS